MSISSAISLEQLVYDAIRGGCEVTLLQLMALFPHEGTSLDRLVRVRELLTKWSLELVPPLERGGDSLIRILRGIRRSDEAGADFMTEIAGGETELVEFKSSLLFDHKQASARPGVAPAHLRSEEVLFSSLKTICAFLNSDGGVLYVGIRDDGSPSCISADCRALGLPAFDRDKWTLEFLNQVTGGFKDGGLVSDYLSIRFFFYNSSWFARISVLKRKASLSFVRNRRQPGGLQIYRRQAGRSLEVQIDQMEEFILQRNGISS